MPQRHQLRSLISAADPPSPRASPDDYDINDVLPARHFLISFRKRLLLPEIGSLARAKLASEDLR
jgi:hypothetical protein